MFLSLEEMRNRLINLARCTKSSTRRAWALRAIAEMQPLPASKRLTPREDKRRIDRIKAWRSEQYLARVLRKGRGRITAEDVPAWMVDSEHRGAAVYRVTCDSLEYRLRQPLSTQWARFGSSMLRDRHMLFCRSYDRPLGFVCMGDEVESYRYGRWSVTSATVLRRLAKCQGEDQARAAVALLDSQKAG